MNRKQKLVLLVGIVIMIIMGIIPPWSAEQQITYRFAKQVIGDDLIADDPSDYPKYGEVIKYRFLFRPPLSILYDEPDPITGKTSDSFEVNYGVLCIQWAVVGLVTGFIIVKSKNKKKQGDIMMTDKEIENKSIELIRIVNMPSGTENERLKELRNLALEVGASHRSVTGNRIANEGELVFNIQNALQTASMLNGCKAANKSANTAIVSAIIAAISALIAFAAVLLN